MSEYAWLAVFSLLIAAFALFGGLLPFRGEISHTRLQFYLTFSAGVMIGAAFFHVMPDAIEQSKEYVGLWMTVAIVGLFCIERFIAPHSHEVDGHHNAGNSGEHHHNEAEHHHHEHEAGHEHDHEHSRAPAPDYRAAAPAVAGWMAVLGLTIHTFMNGVGLAGAVDNDLSKPTAIYVFGFAIFIPGLAMFLAVFLHKPADALAISTVLTRKRVSRRKITWVQLGYVAMIPVGAYAFCLTRGALGETLKQQLTGFALAFSAGTFIFIALSDLLPEVQFHRHDRVPLFLTLVGGVLLMWGIAWLEGLSEGKEKEETTKAVAAASVLDSSRTVR
jgi:zinc and cadmium transporter